MGPIGTGLEFGMELYAYHKGMIRHFRRLDQLAVRRQAAHHDARRFQSFAVLVVDFVAVAVPLHSFGDAVSLGHTGVGLGPERVMPQPHRAAQVGNRPLAVHNINDGISAVRIQLG